MMSVIVRTAARVLLPLVVVYGIYIVANGHLTPGGGFQGGTVIATGFLLTLLAYGKSAQETFREVRLGLAENAGSIAYVTIAFSGLLLGGEFLQNGGIFGLGRIGELFSAGFMLPLNAAIGTKVAAGLGSVAVLFTALVLGENGNGE